MTEVERMNLFLVTGLLTILDEMQVPEAVIFSPTQRELIQKEMDKYEQIAKTQSEDEGRADLILLLQTVREIGNRVIESGRGEIIPSPTGSSIILN